MVLINKKKLPLISQLSLFLLLVHLCQINSQSTCETKRTCGECMQSKDECHWCYPKSFDSNADENKLPQCIGNRNLSSPNECNFEKFPQNSVQVVRDENFRSGTLDKLAIQIRPQELRMKVRAGKQEKIRVKYSLAENYPLDLYYLLDFSDSMLDDKENMSKLSKELATILGNFTTNFRVGLGSFVDKVVAPFSQTRSLDNPCINEGRVCVPTYGFRHHLSFTEDTERFSEAVSKAPISGNTDSPEGAFDGLMQAIVCPEIGWRDKAARKLVILSTDALPHIAGDGKLLGIVRPNDGKCHLDPTSKYYTHSNVLDYPSIGQIASKAKQHSVSVIFAVPEHHKEVYETMNGFIESSGTAVLTSDSSNIIEILSTTIYRITSTVELKDTASAPLKISYQCLWHNSGGFNPPNKCSGFNIRDTIEFDVNIDVPECPEDPSQRKRTFEIYPLGLNESVTVHLEIICDCECEIKGRPGYKENDEMCQGADSKCGVCDCKDGNYGNFCQCKGYSILGKNEVLEQGCKLPNTEEICSNRGKCDCGQCVCDTTDTPGEMFYGKYCECSNFNCKRHNGNVCSGPSQGKCVCQKCKCTPGWEGEACECTTDKSTCIQPGSSLICGGFGTCECGVCKCISNPNSTPPTKYEGQFCQKCIGCETHCEELSACVKCQAFEKTPNCNSTCARDGVNEESNIQILDFVTADPDQDEVDCSQVKIVNKEKKTCTMPFVYRESDDKRVHLKIQKELNCPKDAPLFWIITAPLIITVLIGLVGILIWRVCVYVNNKKEVARFNRERAQESSWKEENILYVPATTEHSNPLYAKLN